MLYGSPIIGIRTKDPVEETTSSKEPHEKKRQQTQQTERAKHGFGRVSPQLWRILEDTSKSKKWSNHKISNVPPLFPSEMTRKARNCLPKPVGNAGQPNLGRRSIAETTTGPRFEHSKLRWHPVSIIFYMYIYIYRCVYNHHSLSIWVYLP